ncbi:type IV fimbrial biogenesis protein FimT [Gammaproteobacteria bacterium]
MTRYLSIQKKIGFTSLEMMVTVSVLAILLAIGVPSFQSIIRNARIVTHTNDFLISLVFARNEAIKRGRRVVACKSKNNICQTDSSGWEQGWIIFVDFDNNSVLDTNDILLRAHGPLTGGDTLTGNLNVKNYIAYSSDGGTRLDTGAFQAGTLVFNLCSSGKRNAIVISNTGRARIMKESC